MNTVANMMQSHPSPAFDDMELLNRCIDDLTMCAQTCTICADACLAETEHLQRLTRCIRLNLDCADVCNATLKLLSRQTHVPWVLSRQQINACMTACELCGAECDMHAEWHEHCRICGDMCRKCSESCKELLDKLPQ